MAARAAQATAISPVWSRRACRIRKKLAIGDWRDDPAKWPDVYAAMVDARIRLEKALKPYIQKLKV